MFKVPEKHRVKKGKYGSDSSIGNNGLFQFSSQYPGSQGVVYFNCIVSDGEDWEHVSVTCRNKGRCPTWEEMCFIKDTFWDKDDWVIQYHPEESEYVSYHDTCLHLWKPINQKIPTPPRYMVGLK